MTIDIDYQQMWLNSMARSLDAVHGALRIAADSHPDDPIAAFEEAFDRLGDYLNGVDAVEGEDVAMHERLKARLAALRGCISPDTPIGTPVVYKSVAEVDFITRTRSEPWQLGHGEWVVSIEGRTGGHVLSHLFPVEGNSGYPGGGES